MEGDRTHTDDISYKYNATEDQILNTTHNVSDKSLIGGQPMQISRL